MCNGLFCFTISLVLITFAILFGIKLSHSEVDFEINKEPIIFSVTVKPLDKSYNMVLSTNVYEV